jgi:hypothetical protein
LTQARTTPEHTQELQDAQRAYQASQRQVKTAVATARKDKLDKDIHFVMQTMHTRDAKNMWQGLKRLGGNVPTGSGPTMLQDSNGVMTMGAQQIANILAAQYEQTTNSESFASGAGFDDQHKTHVEAQVQQYRQSTLNGPEHLSAPIDMVEVQLQCRLLHNRKAPSPIDDINNELLKYGQEHLQAALTALFNLQFAMEHKPQTPGIIIPLYKREDPTMAVNYRPITLGSTIDKLYNLVLNARICNHLESENKLHDAQHGFRPHRSAVDNIFMLAQVIKARKRNKQDTYLLFLDIEKAYDSVWRSGLLYHLWDKGITGKMFRVLAQMTDNPSSMVMHKGTYSDSFTPGMGWEQGDTLATTMFNVHIDAVLQHVWTEHPGVPIPTTQNTEQHNKLVALMYADDLGGVADSPQALTTLVQSIRTALTKWRLKASVKATDGSKTAVMVVKSSSRQGAATQQHSWMWGDVQIPQVSSYKYLGAWLTEKGTWEEHITKRIAKASAAAASQHSIMSQSRLPWHLRHLTLTSVVQPVLTYATQVWNTCTRSQRVRLDTWQMNVVKRMTHTPANASTSCLQQELGILPLHMSCDIWTLSYWHRLRTMSSDRMLQQIFSAWMDSFNPWQQNVNKLLIEYKVDAVTSLTYSKDKFTRYVRSLVMDHLHTQWEEASTRQQSGICTRYKETHGPGHIEKGMNGMHPIARKYFSALSMVGRGTSAEICMKLRTETLPLKCIHGKSRKNETIVAQQTRERCPLCKQTPETPAHFLLQCPAYTTLREPMMLHLTNVFPQLIAGVQADHTQWRSLLTDLVLDAPVVTSSGTSSAPAAASDSAAAPGSATAPTSAAAPGSATALGLVDEVVAFKQWPVIDYLMSAWKLRSSALTGRETNGGDAMVSGR